MTQTTLNFDGPHLTAADAAAYAANAANDAANAAEARRKVLAQCCEIIRRHYPEVPSPAKKARIA